VCWLVVPHSGSVAKPNWLMTEMSEQICKPEPTKTAAIVESVSYDVGTTL